tara:strand:+ start:2811 stop:3281 length:471 start_codon:yes stop_codon:yes gene_type:complete
MTYSKQITQKLSDLDRKILEILLKNSRISSRQIAKKTKNSVATIINHIKRLEDNGIIKKYTAVLDYDKIGYDVGIIVQVRISKGNLKEVFNQFASYPNVISVYDVIGNFDAIVIARFKSRKQVRDFIHKIQNFEFVERTETILVLDSVKEQVYELL